MKFKKFYIAITIFFIPSLISVILWLLGILDIKYMVTINIISFLSWFTIFIIFINILIRNNNSIIAIPKICINEKYLPAGKEIFEKYMFPVNPHRDCIFRIKMELKDVKDSPKITIIRKCQTDTCEDILNNKIILDEGKIHIFDVRIDRKERLNFKFDKDVTIKSFSIEELYFVR